MRIAARCALVILTLLAIGAGLVRESHAAIGREMDRPKTTFYGCVIKWSGEIPHVGYFEQNFSTRPEKICGIHSLISCTIHQPEEVSTFSNSINFRVI